MKVDCGLRVNAACRCAVSSAVLPAELSSGSYIDGELSKQDAPPTGSLSQQSS
jgi:hypothetical protein